MKQYVNSVMCWAGAGWATVIISAGTVFEKENRVSALGWKEDFTLSVFAGFLARAPEESLLRGCFHFLA